MADETKDALKTEEPKATVDDKTLTEKISAFFAEKFGASGESKPTATDPKAEEDRIAIASAKAEAETAKREAAEAKTRVAQLEKDARTSRFGAIAKDWPGEGPKHIAMLELLATTQEGGEQSGAFTDYVTQQNAIAEQLKVGALFEELGSSQPVEGSAQAIVAAKVKDAQAADPKLTKEAAFDSVWQSLTPSMREQYRSEEKRTLN